MKFIKNNSKKFYIIGSVILLLMICLVGVLIAGEFTKKTHAAPETVTVQVRKNSTLTVYVSGKGVVPDRNNSTDNIDVYVVEKNTPVSIRAVNETKIFNGWNILNAGGTSFYATTIDPNDAEQTKINIANDVRYDFTASEDITIQANGRDALLADFGMYKNSYFNIQVEKDLTNLQLIYDAVKDIEKVKVKEVLDAYDSFFKNYSFYEKNILSVTDANTKADLIIKNDLFAKIQRGFYYVTSSFSLLSDSFTGIGSLTTPFEGVICGNVSGVSSTIFTTMTSKEKSGDIYTGLFKVTGEEAVIRNLKIRTSIGIEEGTAASNIYAGGIAGYVNKSVLSNVDLLARIAIESSGANLFAGAVGGKFEGGLDRGRGNIINGDNATFILSTKASGKNIYAGLVTGNAENVYVKEAEVRTTNFAISAKNTASNTYSNNTNVYLGNLFGKYTATTSMPIEEVKLTGTSKESITSLISSGNSYIGGLIGHLTTSTGSVELGDISITNTNGESKLSASSVDSNSQTNLYTAGLIACVVGNNLVAKPEFLDGVVERTIDGKKYYEYDYIFNTNLKIESTNHGEINGNNYGKVVSTGFIAQGYMDLSGTDAANVNEILLSSGKYQTKVYATQSSTSSGSAGTNKEHCIASAVFGSLVYDSATNIENLNIYASNFDISATRELGSTGVGDIHAAGFIGSSIYVVLNNVSLFMNDSYIKGHSLSYEVENNTNNINNLFVGGIIGSVNDRSTNLDQGTFNNITFAGDYDHATKEVVGTTSKIEGIQNTTGNSNYRNEGYIGGLFGGMFKVNCSNIEYIGSPTDEDQIVSLGHENPATAFCGGLIGYIYNENNGINVQISNASISNAKVYLGATVVDIQDNMPDVYIGGIVGSIFHGGQNRSITISNSRVLDTDIICDGNEHVMIYVGGVIASAAWGGSITVSDTYVMGCDIESHLNVNTNLNSTPGVARPTAHSCAAGIVGRSYNNTTVSNSAVIDTNIVSTYNSTFEATNTTAYNAVVTSSGIHGEQDSAGTVNITNSYSNATLSSSISRIINGTTVEEDGECFGIIDSGIGDTVSSYYVRQNFESDNYASSDGTALDFSNKEVGTTNTLLFTTGTNSLPMTSSKYYINLVNTTDFAVGTTDNNLGVYAINGSNASYADIWINAKNGGDTNQSPFNANYETDEDRMNAGWFRLGSLVVFNGTPSSSSTLSNTKYSLIDNVSEYDYVKDNEFKNIHYPYNTITSTEYVINTGTPAQIGENSITVINAIDVYVTSHIRQFKISLSMNPAEYYPVLVNSEGTIINTNDLKYDEYGLFDYQINGTSYVITYEPNKSISHNDTFYICFMNANKELLTSACYKFNINYNKTNFVGVIYADYSKPLNYQDITFSNTIVDPTNPNPVVYKLRAGKIVKLLPVFEMTNEPGVYVISELNVSKVSYTSDDLSNGASLKSNGEFTAPTQGSGTIVVTYIENGETQSKSIKFTVVNEVQVTYTSVGADINALTYATSDNEYYMGIDLLDHYGGNPIKFDISYEGTIDENIFVSPKLPDNADALSLTLGGATGTIQIYFSRDNGTTWGDAQDITLNNSNYIEYDQFDIEDKGYTNFKLVNKTGNQIGIRAYAVTVNDVEYTKTSDIQNSDRGGDAVIDSNGNQMFTISDDAQITRDETQTITNNEIDNFPLTTTTSPRYNYYSKLVVEYTGTATIYVDRTVYERGRNNNSNPTLVNNPSSYTIQSSGYELNFDTEWAARYDQHTTDISLRIQNKSSDFIITRIYVEYYSGNNSARLGTADYNISNDFRYNNRSLEGITTTYSDNYILVNGEATFTFNDPLTKLPVISSTGTITNQSYTGNTYTIEGNNVKITSVNATLNGDQTTTFTYSSINTNNLSATFTSSAGGTVTGSFNGCTSGINALLLYGEGYIIKSKQDVMINNWIEGYTAWDIEATKYTLNIPQELIQSAANAGSNININIEFPIVYTVSFDVQSDSFNPENDGETFISFKVEAGTTFNQLFGTYEHPTESLNRIANAVTKAKLFGFVYGGFYLIDSGNSLSAYSKSFEDLLKEQGDLQIYTSYMYYARWSFLIEHIEAPGTTIRPSFEEGFLEDLGLTPDEQEQLDLNGKLTIPINNTRGYVFTVEKEEGFIGEAQVNAYIVDSAEHVDSNEDGMCDICGNDILKVGHVREIQVEKYHENMYLYYVPAEAITGYLVIVSNVTNSSIIVGKNTASVTEQILPEDGVYTFKYVVNHKKNESYIYDPEASLLGVKKNILVEFKQQIYNGTTTDITDRVLPVGTTVEVFYSLYRDGALSDQKIGVYTANGTETNITLDAFNEWNQYVPAFNTSETFNTFLGSNNTVSEVYYFVVTPPNGYNPYFNLKGNEIVNHIIYIGYCHEDKETYLVGSRSDDGIINNPLEDLIGVTAQKETSKQEKIYSVTPSRQTSLSKDGNNYTFTDVKTYHLVDLTVDNGSYVDSKLVLSDNSTNNTIITSSEINGNICELGLKLGNNIGTVKVLGKKTETSEWQTIASFNVESIDYQYYYVDFEALGTDYKYFQIDNVSLNEIRLEAFSYSTISNAMLYEFNISDANINGNVYSYVNEIVGDTRHDGKTFMLELEFENTTDISNEISINVNGTIVKPLLAERDGKVRAYFNLSEQLTTNVRTITFTINTSGETLVKVKLLEASTAQKPAVSEERVVIIP